MYSWPSEHRGQKFVNPIPYRQQFVFPMSGDNNGLATHPTDQKIGFFLLLIGVGIIAYFLGKSNSSTRRNPYCSRMRTRRRMSKVSIKRRRRRAYEQPRDELGRFLPTR
jgi:hypothetical protein